ncbi:MAG TPA: acyl-CoA dehydrogenase family protein, partial [Chloroflexota bacterium]|nr:acyl-CoA dehydrogenase family protein [Chloroflexota bacterium]
CGERAAAYDRRNAFFEEDFAALEGAGYLRLAVPRELGGPGLSLAEVAREQRRLAYRAPATALGLNMHQYWTGVAADLYRQGDPSLEWLLREALAGQVFAAGHAEAGNDLPLLLSSTRAEQVDGGYRFWGRKQFGNLTPVWTRLGIHAMDATDPRGPQIVHAFLPRDTPGYRVEETWDALGMRATRSDDTILEGAFIPERYVARVVPAGAMDGFVLAVFAWVLTSFANIYYAIGRRAFDLAVEAARRRTSLGLGRSMAYHPEVQHCLAEMAMELEAMEPHLDRVAEEWSRGVEHEAAWPMKLVALKHRCVEGARRVVDLALTVCGGTGMLKSHELERLYRDVRCGGFHPANSLLAHEIVGKTALGIDLGEQPRWG